MAFFLLMATIPKLANYRKEENMNRKICMLSGYLSIFFFALGTAAQTVTTNGGATNTIPKFSSSTQIVNSSLSETNGNLTIPDNAYITDIDGLFYSGNLNLTTS